jgi:hypothetical protein
MPDDAERQATMDITRQSPVADWTNTMSLHVTQEQLDAWAAGTPIREAMPQLSEAERVFLVSGVTPADLTVDMSEREFDEHMNQKAELDAGIAHEADGPDFG